MSTPLQFASLYDDQEVFVRYDYLLDLGTDFLICNMYHLISMARILLRSSSVRVHDSQANWKMDVTRECIRRILELRGMLLSFQTGFNLVSAIVVCAVLESISGLEFLSDTTEPKLSLIHI